jgi:F0F1-type ATP synthase membrane subunit b/b'
MQFAGYDNRPGGGMPSNGSGGKFWTAIRARWNAFVNLFVRKSRNEILEDARDSLGSVKKAAKGGLIEAGVNLEEQEDALKEMNEQLAETQAAIEENLRLADEAKKQNDKELEGHFNQIALDKANEAEDLKNGVVAQKELLDNARALYEEQLIRSGDADAQVKAADRKLKQAQFDAKIVDSLQAQVDLKERLEILTGEIVTGSDAASKAMESIEDDKRRLKAILRDGKTEAAAGVERRAKQFKQAQSSEATLAKLRKDMGIGQEETKANTQGGTTPTGGSDRTDEVDK